MKLTYKNNIVKETSSSTSYKVVDNNNVEVDSNMTLEDAKFTVREFNNKL